MILCTYQPPNGVPGSRIVKARKHPGSPSLDLTIPAKESETNDIRQGDIFEVEITGEKDNLKVIYKRVYHKRP